MSTLAHIARALVQRKGEPEQLNSEPTMQAEGLRARREPDEDAIYRRALEEWEQTAQQEEQRASQVLQFDRGPVCLVFAGDQHLGNRGTDYKRCFDELELIAATPGMWLVSLGDLLDNFVIGNLRRIRDDARFTIGDEWVLVRRYLRAAGPKLAAMVSGNHDEWAKLLMGIDYFQEVLAGIAPTCLYDVDDARIRVQVGDWTVPMRIRHHWAGHSIYNITHGIERAALWDQDFTLGAGAHRHRGGVARAFVAGGRPGMAVMVGTYKRVDAYARRLGVPMVNNSTAVAVLLDPETQSLTGFDNLQLAARYMQAVYQG